MKRALVVLLMVLAATAAAEEMTLNLALELAVENHPALIAAEAARDAADARADQAGALPNPRVFLKVEDAPRDGDAWKGSNRVVGLSQTIPWSGRIGAEKRAAEALADRAELERRIALSELRARVRIAFAEAVYAREMSRLTDRTVSTFKTLVNAAAAKVEAGDAAGLDLHRAEMELARARIAAREAHGRETSAYQALSALTGRDVDSVKGELDPPTEALSFEALRPRLLESPYVLAAERDAAMADALVSAASRMRLPELELEAGLRTAPGGEGFDAGVGLSVPLFDRGGARLRAARADKAALQAASRSVLREREAELQRLVADYEAARFAVEQYADGLTERANDIVLAADIAYGSGEVSMTDMVQMHQVWVETRGAQLGVELELVALESSVMRSLGD